MRSWDHRIWRAGLVLAVAALIIAGRSSAAMFTAALLLAVGVAWLCRGALPQ